LTFPVLSAVTTTRSRKGGRSETTSALRPPDHHPAARIHARARAPGARVRGCGAPASSGWLTPPLRSSTLHVLDQLHQAIRLRATSCASRRACTRCTTHRARTVALFPCRPRQALCIRNTARTNVGCRFGSSLDLSIVAPPRSGTLRPASLGTPPEARCQGCEAPSAARLALDTEGRCASRATIVQEESVRAKRALALGHCSNSKRRGSYSADLTRSRRSVCTSAIRTMFARVSRSQASSNTTGTFFKSTANPPARTAISTCREQSNVARPST
jgi:hypothetical protein